MHGAEDDVAVPEVPAGQVLPPDPLRVVGALHQRPLVRNVVLPVPRRHRVRHDLVHRLLVRQQLRVRRRLGCILNKEFIIALIGYWLHEVERTLQLIHGN